MNIANLEGQQMIISIISIVITSIISLITIIITCYNANRQVQESKKARDQQKQQYEENLKLHKVQYEREIEHNRNVELIRERPYLVFVKSADFNTQNSSYNTLSITFKNKGNGTAFNLIPDLKSESNHGTEGNIIIRRNLPIQDPVAVVGESFKTYWAIEKVDNIIGVLIPITISYTDASDNAYQQIFMFTIDNEGNVMLTNYAKPELINE